MPSFLLFAAFLLAVLHWIARWREIRWLHLFTKPAVLVLLILWFWQAGGWQGQSRWFGYALLASLLGDVLLMLPQSFFLPGLGAFLGGHLFYIFGFSIGPLTDGLQLWFLRLVTVMVTGILARYFYTTLSRRNFSKRISFAVVAYVVVILYMVYSALSTFLRPNWTAANALLVSCGALLFFVSDGLLGYDRFVKKAPNAHLWIMMSYHAAQFLIIWGALRHFA